MKTAAVCAATLAVMTAPSFASEQLMLGTYTGTYEVYYSSRPSPVGANLTINSVDGDEVKAVLTSSSPSCNGEYALEGRYVGRDVVFTQVSPAAREGCRFNMRLAVRGNQLVGRTRDNVPFRFYK
jgi:hypothetical protein